MQLDTLVSALFFDAVFLIVLTISAVYVGRYCAHILFGGEIKVRWLARIEKGFYRLLGEGATSEQTPRRYTMSVLAVSVLSLVLLFAMQMLQKYIGLNPTHLAAPDWRIAINTAVSFVTNTNWQTMAVTHNLSFFVSMLGLTVQNFLSAAVGIAVFCVITRGFSRTKSNTVGNFFVDVTRSILYILLPLSIVLGVALIAAGVVQTLTPSLHYTELASGIRSVISLGPVASQEAIKQLGTNGGGFYAANSAYPLENSTFFSNILELFALLLIPAALCFAFGRGVGNKKQGWTLYVVMLILFSVATFGIAYSEYKLNPHYKGVSMSSTVSGNLEGKELRNGVTTSALWAGATTAASNGSVNSTLDSFTPVSGFVLLALMQTGEVVFGGVGSGLYGLLAFCILAVFIAGLMVGRTPEFLGKKIEPFEMKMVCLVILVPSFLILGTTAVATLLPSAQGWLGNPGAHGFSELLYTFTSMGANNGSSFAGMKVDSTFVTLAGSLSMLLARFVPLIAVIYFSGSLARKSLVASSAGTLSTTNTTFVILLLIVVVLIGVLSFLPALSLGPLADFFNTAHVIGR
ncbi:MAG: potassium-transporting ATPase subunit KdpA [Coriobacteriia bacterium]|nr:potassium-transporting ATPase subunit KdpA [Coriobacteriia bacterium]